ncbi:hypothetical protein HQ531_02750 [bacterium]|nr:hypothetical protein [bacterium]
MPNNKFENLKTQIQLLQEKNWTNEEKLESHLECLLKQRAQINKLQIQVDKLQALISKISSQAKPSMKGGKR